MRSTLVMLVVVAVSGCDGPSPTSDTHEARPFCVVVDDVNELYRTTSDLAIDHTMTSDEVDRRVRSFESQIDLAIERSEQLFAELETAAPVHLQPDIRLLAEDAAGRAKAFRASGGDPITLLRGLWPPAHGVALRGAMDRVDDHAREECGRGFGPPTEVRTPDLPAEPLDPPVPPAWRERPAPPPPPPPPPTRP